MGPGHWKGGWVLQGPLWDCNRRESQIGSMTEAAPAGQEIPHQTGQERGDAAFGGGPLDPFSEAGETSDQAPTGLSEPVPQ